jgi:3-oxoacyl-[acyl-carrier protein] reductase
MFDLSDQAALVTGASGGIGAAIARALHAQGATVMLAGRRQAALEALSAALGERVYSAGVELADPAAADRLIRDAEAAMGRVDILVNNAGITRDALALRMTDEDWQTVLDIDLSAAFRLTRAALRGMVRRRYGRIIAVTSIVALTGNPGQANYAAAKAGMIGMTKSLAAEIAGRGITANCVAPGLIATPMTERLPPERRERLTAAIPLGRFGRPDEIAAAVVFLASREAAYLTGQTLHINGGMAML